jgi:hypothetical protein
LREKFGLCSRFSFLRLNLAIKVAKIADDLAGDLRSQLPILAAESNVIWGFQGDDPSLALSNRLSLSAPVRLSQAKWSISQLITSFQKRRRVPWFGTPKHAFEYESMAPIIQTWSSFVKRTTKGASRTHLWARNPSVGSLELLLNI